MFDVVRFVMEIGLLRPDVFRPYEKMLGALAYVAVGDTPNDEIHMVRVEKLAWTSVLQHTVGDYRHRKWGDEEVKHHLSEIMTGMRDSLLNLHDPLAILSLEDAAAMAFREQQSQTAGRELSLLEALRRVGPNARVTHDH